MNFWGRLKEDFQARRNLDGYITLVIAIVVVILDVFGIANVSIISAAILAVLALVSFSLLQTRQENQELRESLSRIGHIAPAKSLAEARFARRNDENDKDIYELMIKTMTSAKESIKVISLYKPPNMSAPPERTRYFDELHKFLEEKQKNNDRFTFERLIQVQDVSDTTMTPERTEPLTYKHCQFLAKMQQKGGNLRIMQKQIQDGLSPIGFVLVDQSKIMLLLPSVRIDQHGNLSSHKHVGAEIVFLDREGDLATSMKDLFDDLRDNGAERFTISLDS